MGGEKPSRSKKKHDGLESVDSPDIIEADEIIVEIIDKHTGRKFRRTLPVRYYETANGVVLEGETPDGDPSRISFFSAAAMARLNDLFGKGPDAPRCDGHEPTGRP